MPNCAATMAIYLLSPEHSLAEVPILPDANHLQFSPEDSGQDNYDEIVLEVERSLNNICAYTGISCNFVLAVDEMPNAMSFMLQSGRGIIYDYHFIIGAKRASTHPDWAVTSILSHEMAHHLDWHLFDRTKGTREKELEADVFSGFIMQRMGASLKEAQAFMDTSAQDWETPTHPSRSVRLAAIEQGWRQAQSLSSRTSALKDK